MTGGYRAGAAAPCNIVSAFPAQSFADWQAPVPQWDEKLSFDVSPQHPQADGWWCQWWCGCGRKWWGELPHLRGSLLFLCEQSPCLDRLFPGERGVLATALFSRSHPYQGRWFSRAAWGAGLSGEQAWALSVCVWTGPRLPTSWKHNTGRAVLFERERELLRLVRTVCLHPYCTPAGVWRAPICPNLCSTLCWHGGEGKAVRFALLETYTLFVKKRQRLQKGRSEFQAATARSQLIGPDSKSERNLWMEEPCYCFTLGHYYSSSSTEPRSTKSSCVRRFKNFSCFWLNLSQHFGEAAKLCQISHRYGVYLEGAGNSGLPSCWLVCFLNFEYSVFDFLHCQKHLEAVKPCTKEWHDWWGVWKPWNGEHLVQFSVYKYLLYMCQALF